MTTRNSLEWRFLWALYVFFLVYQLVLPVAPLPGTPSLGDLSLAPLLSFPAQISFTDVVSNGGAFFVLGLLTRMIIGAQGDSLRSWALCIGVGLGISFSAEMMQQVLPGRTSSGLDVLVDLVGTTGGMFFTSRYSGILENGQVAVIATVRRVGWLPTAYAAGLVLYCLWPFHLRTSPSDIARGLRSIEWIPPFGSLVMLVTSVKGYARVSALALPLGALLGGRSDYRSRRLVLLGGFLGVGLVNEGLQVMVEWHLPSLPQALAATLGALIGAEGAALIRRVTERV